MKCINCQSPMVRNDESGVVEFECSNLDCATFYYPPKENTMSYNINLTVNPIEFYLIQSQVESLKAAMLQPLTAEDIGTPEEMREGEKSLEDIKQLSSLFAVTDVRDGKLYLPLDLAYTLTADVMGTWVIQAHEYKMNNCPEELSELDHTHYRVTKQLYRRLADEIEEERERNNWGHDDSCPLSPCICADDEGDFDN